MKAILINPFEKSIELIDVKSGYSSLALEALYKLVGEDGIDAAYIMPGESIIVGDHSSLHDPPLASFAVEGYKFRLYGRAVVIGYSASGEERETRLSVEDVAQLITFE